MRVSSVESEHVKKSWQTKDDLNQYIKGKHTFCGKQAIVHMVLRRFTGKSKNQLLSKARMDDWKTDQQFSLYDTEMLFLPHLMHLNLHIVYLEAVQHTPNTH